MKPGCKVLVTGANGFIGSHLAEELVRQGYRVRSLVYYNSFSSWGWLEQSPKEIQKEMEIFQGDVRDPYRMRQAVEGMDAVFHLAALIAIPYSYASPDAYIETNVRGTLNVLQAVRDFKVGKLVQTSTSEVYGTAQFVPITENHPLVGQSPYSASKIGADQLALAFHHSFGTPVAILRPFNTYGPRQSARAIIPTVITQIANGQRRIKLGSLHPTRDFCFVKDTVRGFIECGRSDQSIGQVINVGSSFEISIEETARTIASVMGAEIEIESEQSRIRPPNSEVERLYASIDKAGKLLKWRPEYGGLDGFRRGIRETAEWFSNPENLRNYKTHLYNI